MSRSEPASRRRLTTIAHSDDRPQRGGWRWARPARPTDDDDGARAAFQWALELDPEVEGAEEGLEQLVRR